MKKIPWLIAILAAILLTYFVFIPAFRGDLSINPVIQIGLLSFRWYGLILAGSILTGYLIIRKQSWKFGVDPGNIDNLAFWLTLVGLIGGRIYYVLFLLPYFLSNPAEIYKIWHGGLSIYGAILSGIIFVYFYCRKKAYSFWQLADLLVLGLPLAQAIGRVGNFVNQEAYGLPTNLPWKMYVNGEYVHPAFLYESLANVTIFVILFKLIGKVKTGTIALVYLFSYSLARFFIEAIRTDSFFLYGFRVDQLISFGLVVLSAVFIYRRQLRSAKSLKR